MIAILLALVAGASVFVYLHRSHKSVVSWLLTEPKVKPKVTEPPASSAATLKERLAKPELPSDMLSAITEFSEALPESRGELFASFMKHYGRMHDDDLWDVAGKDANNLITFAQFLQKNSSVCSGLIAPTASAHLITRLRRLAYKMTNSDPASA
jgi:hypothetical protein